MNRQKKASEREGNTGPLSQPTRKTFYCFTAYGITDEDKEKEFNRQLGTLAIKYLYGHEICPTTGRPHLQGFMHLKKAMRITEIKLLGNPRLEACNGSEASNIRYCSKEGNRIIKYGFPKPLPTPDCYIMHLQWIKNHPNFIPADGNSVDNTTTGKGRVIPHIESMTLVYQNPYAQKLAETWYTDDLRAYASIKTSMASFEHTALY